MGRKSTTPGDVTGGGGAATAAAHDTGTKAARLAAKIEALRRARNLSIRDLAARCGVSSTTVARWLDAGDDAEPRLSEARVLAALFGVPVDYLGDDALVEPPAPPAADEAAVLRAARILLEERGADEVMRRLMREGHAAAAAGRVAAAIDPATGVPLGGDDRPGGRGATKAG